MSKPPINPYKPRTYAATIENTKDDMSKVVIKMVQVMPEMLFLWASLPGSSASEVSNGMRNSRNVYHRELCNAEFVQNSGGQKIRTYHNWEVFQGSVRRQRWGWDTCILKCTYCGELIRAEFKDDLMNVGFENEDLHKAEHAMQ